MRIFIIPLTALALGAISAPVAAQSYENGRNDRAYADQAELRRSQQRIEAERRDLRDAQRYGDKRDVNEQRRDVKQAQNEYRRDAKDYHRGQQQARNNARDWQRGRNYSYNRPDPRYNGYYADNYYRSGVNYRTHQMSYNDRIYRGQDNRYYCRRSDGTTGLIIGAIGGGVLGNVIAPGGSKTLGSLLGGGLGAVLGNSIDRNNVSCR